MSLKELSARVPVIHASGTNLDIGRTVGEKAKVQISNNLAHLKESVSATVGHPWPVCVEICRAFLPVVTRLCPEYLEELQGMSEGSGVSFDDLFTLNCRTEIGSLFTQDRSHNFMTALSMPVGECSVLGINQTRTKDHTNIYAQNWDSSYTQHDTIAFFVIDQPDKPSIAWIGEAGLLCRMGGMNSAGIGLGGNTLISDSPIDFDALPLQFAYRKIMDQDNYCDAVTVAGDNKVGSTINLLIAGSEGEMCCMETEYKGFTMNYMENGVISHANVYKNPKGPHAPYRDMAPSASFIRSFRLGCLVDNLKGDELTVEDVMKITTEHVPNGTACICRHGEKTVTVTASICDLNKLEMYVAPEQPCKGYYHVRPFEEIKDWNN